MAKWAVPEIVLNDGANNYAVGSYFTSDDFRAALARKAYSFAYITPHYYDSNGEEIELCENVEEATVNFYRDFLLWKDSRLPEFDRIYNAINVDYEPLENYNRLETYTLEKHRGSQEEYNIDDKDTGTDTAAHTGTIKKDTSGTETGTDAVAHTGTITEKENGTETGTDATAHTGTITEKESGTETGTDRTEHTGTIQKDTSGSEGGTDIHALTGTDTKESTSNGTNAQNVYGFNSTDAVPSDTSTVSGTTTDTTTKGTTDTETKDLSTTGTEKNTFDNTDAETKDLATSSDKTTTHADTDTETKDLATSSNKTTTRADTDTETKDLKTTDTETQTFADTETETKNLTHAKTGTTKFSDQSESVYDHDKYSESTHGNIGVTTSQQMLESELKLRDLIDFKTYIIRDFCRRVLVMGVRYHG